MAKAEGMNVCVGCIWNDECGFVGPCSHYTPGNYEEILDARDIEDERKRYNEEWQEYIDYYTEAYN